MFISSRIRQNFGESIDIVLMYLEIQSKIGEVCRSYEASRSSSQS